MDVNQTYIQTSPITRLICGVSTLCKMLNKSVSLLVKLKCSCGFVVLSANYSVAHYLG